MNNSTAKAKPKMTVKNGVVYGDAPVSYTHLIRHFTDDGVSGTTFEREGFQAMIAEVEAGNVSAVIVKDYCAIIGLNQKDLENQGILA